MYSSTDNPPDRMKKTAIKKTKSNQRRYIVFLVIASSLGSSFMYGYNTSVINAPADHVMEFINSTYVEHYENGLTVNQLNGKLSLVMSLYVIGGAVGCLWFPKFLTHRYGTAKALVLIAPIGLSGTILSFISPFVNSDIPLYIGRFAVGFHSGIAMATVPGFLHEIAPHKWRGPITSSTSLGLVVGLFIANALGLPWIIGSLYTWQYLFLFGAACYIFHMAGMIVPTKRTKWSSEDDDDSRMKHFDDFIKDRSLWLPLFLSINVTLCLPLTGIPVVSMYASIVLENAGLNESTAKLANLGLSAVNVIVTLVVMFIVDKVGRKPLMLVSLAGSAVSLAGLTTVLHFDAYYGAIGAMALFQFWFSVGVGAVPWIIVAELFQYEARPAALSLANLFIWLGLVAVAYSFPYILIALDEYSFIPFAVFNAFEFVLLAILLPETKHHLQDEGQSIEVDLVDRESA